MNRRLAMAVVAFLLVVGAVLLSLRTDPGSIHQTVRRDAHPRGEPAGRVIEPRLRGRGDRFAGAGHPEAETDATGAGAGADREEDAVYSVWPSLRVETVDGMTGRAVSATWNLGTGRVVAGPYPPGMVIDEAAVARSREGVRQSIVHWESHFLAAGEAREETFLPNEDVDTAYVVRPAPGFVLEDPSPRMVARIAAGVEQAVFVLPVWPEAILDLLVLDPEGNPAHGVELDALVVAGRRRDDLEIQAEGLAPGRLRIRGIPGLPGEEVEAVFVWGWTEDLEDDVECVEEIGTGEELDDPQLVTRIPEDPRVPWHVEVYLLGPRGPDWDVEIDNDLFYEESLGDDCIRDAEASPASVRVRALGWDGVPVAGATVNGEETDAQGEVLFSEVTPGERTFVMRAAGRFLARRSVVLAEGESAELTLQEPRGAKLEVLVTDEKGRPRPSACLRVLGHRVFDVVDGVQRLDLFTDALGRRTLRRVEPGTVTISARWGSRRGRKTVELRDGETTSIRIVAR